MGSNRSSFFRQLPILLALSSLGAACSGTGPKDPPASRPQGPAELISFTADPSSLVAAGFSTLRWSTSNATSIALSRNGEDLDLAGASPAAGSLLVQVTETSTFELVASGVMGAPASAQLTVQVGEAPSIGSFEAPADVTLQDAAIATLRWSGVVGATELSLESDRGPSLELDPASSAGSIDVELTEDTTFTLIARNPSGAAEARASVRLIPPPAIASFSAEPSWIGSGETATLHWTTIDATRLELWADGVQLGVLDEASGSFPREVLLDTRFELRAYNEAGTVAVSFAEVEVGAPEVFSFEGSSDRLWLGQALLLSWEIGGARRLEILTEEEGADPLCVVEELQTLDRGGCEWQPPETGIFELILSITNGSGVASESLRIEVSSGPTIASFLANPEAITLGEEVLLSWRVGADLVGEAPELSLRDSRGGEFTIGSEEEGILRLIPGAKGEVVYTLRAKTSHELSQSATAQATVRIYELPDLGFTATPELFRPDEAEHVTLSWTSAGAAMLSLYRLEGDESILVLEVPEEERSAGSFAFIPTESTRFRMVATNAAGGVTTEEAEVALVPTDILSFTASPDEVVAGSGVLLSWTTQLAERIELDIFSGPYVIEEKSERYLDAESAGGTHLPLGPDCDPRIVVGGCATLSFPAGFRFPFDGDSFTAARIYGSGVISFEPLVAAGSNGNNQRLPIGSSTNPSWVHLAPFWDDLGWDEARYPAGNIHYFHREGEGGKDSLVIQWKDVGFAPANMRDASLNFEVILWSDGNFEYRYGDMERGSATAGWENGLGATIGYQNAMAADWDLRAHLGSPGIRGSLHQRNFTYTIPPPLTADGSFLWHPFAGAATTASATLWVDGNRSDSETVTVSVLAKPELVIAQRPEAPVEIDSAFRIGWTTARGERLEVVDSSGSIRCTATSMDIVQSGVCQLQESFPGHHDYRIRLFGPLGSVVEKTVGVLTYLPFGIVHFSADSYSLEQGEALTLQWETFNASSISLLANGLELLPLGALSGPGSLRVDDLQENTTFVLRLTTGDGVVKEASLTVELWKVRFSVSARETTLRSGQPVEIDLSAISVGDQPNPPIFGTFPMSQVGGSIYEDISTKAGATQLLIENRDSGRADISLPMGFVFPYFGEDQGWLRVFVDGFVSFDRNADYTVQNRPLPEGSTSSYRSIHLAPFWDDLRLTEASAIWTAQPDPQTFVIQWTHVSLYAGMNANVSQDLNFQLVLHRSGAFEYRYGDMKAQAPPATFGGCYPNTCENEVNASSATVGYQDPAAITGYNLHFGGTANHVSNSAFPGGLSLKSFRYEPLVGTGQLVMPPRGSGTYLYCTHSGAERICKSVDVIAEFAVDSFTADSYLVGIGQTTTLRWKTRGGYSVVLQRNGSTIWGTGNLAEVDQGSFDVTLSEAATYTLQLAGASSSPTASLRIDVARMTLIAAASTLDSTPGAGVMISWDLDVLDPSLHPVIVMPMEETTAPFWELDLASDSRAETLVSSGPPLVVPHSFQDGFTFNYLGVEMSSVQISSRGYLSFDTAHTTPVVANQRLPNAGAAAIHIAPFWDELETRISGRVLVKRIDADRYVIQWSRMSLATGSDENYEYDLNFMVVLHRSGDFEYRFGAMMEPYTPGGFIPCFPAGCHNEANGSGATSGYQDTRGATGGVIHFSGTYSSPATSPIQGGFSGRSWRFTATSASGSVEVQPFATTSYRICALDHASGYNVCAAPIEVGVSWGIDSFEANSWAVLAGDPVRISWEVRGVEELVLTGNGAELQRYTGAAIPLSGSFDHQPSMNTEYKLEVSSLGRLASQSRTVELRAFTMDVSASAAPFFPGEQVLVSWNFETHQGGHLGVVAPMDELPAGAGQPAAYADISQKSGASRLTPSHEGNGFYDLGLSFPFPYFGADRGQVRIYVDGYLSFDFTSATSNASNARFPRAPLAERRIHIAPFWDDLQMRGGDELWTWSPDADSIVIQWSHFNRNAGSSETARYDLNFQVVLFRSGAFEFRYGAMDAPAQPFTYSSCYPNTCVNEANGSSATIGYQTVDGLHGQNLHYGGNSQATVVELEGGLAHRSFRYDPAPSGTARIRVGKTQDYQVCGFLGTFSECRTFTLHAVAEPGDLMITELMLDPAEGVSGQWLEIRNLTRETIDLNGFVLATTAGESFRISSPLPVPPRTFVTLARSDSAGLAPDLVYGSSLGFDTLQGGLRLEAGAATISSVRWGGSWSIPTGRSLELDPSLQIVGRVENDDAAHWCSGTAAGSPGSLGVGCRNPYYDLDPTAAPAFIDIASIGTRFRPLEANNAIVAFPVDTFSMPFFGNHVDKLWVSTNGWISFSSTAPTGGTSSPTAALVPRRDTVQPKGPLIAGFWTGLSCNPAPMPCSFAYYLGDFGGERALLLQWTDYRAGSFAGSITFQIQLWERGDVVVAFDEVVSYEDPGMTGWSAYHGNTAWIALEDSDMSYHQGHHRTLLDFDRRTFRFRRK